MTAGTLHMREMAISALKGLSVAALRVELILPRSIVRKYDDLMEGVLERIDDRLHGCAETVMLSRYQERLSQATLRNDIDAVIRLLGDPPPDKD